MPKSSKSTRERDRGTPREVDRVPRVVNSRSCDTPRPRGREVPEFFGGPYRSLRPPLQFTANGWKKRRE